MYFNALNSAYRGVQFGFSGNYKDAAKTFVAWPALVPFTMGLLWPLVQYKQNNMVIAKSAFGAQHFEFSARPGEFYRIYLAFIGLLVVTGIVAVILMAGIGSFFSGGDVQSGLLMGSMVLLPIISIMMLFILQLFFYTYLEVRVRNLVYNNILISKSFFESRMKVRELFRIYLTNIIAIILSFGLLLSWTMVRLARYRAEHTFVNTPGKIEDIPAKHGENNNAMGEEIGDMFDVGVGI